MNPGTESSIRIEERAAAWLTQRDSGDWTEADEREFQTWLEASTAHEVAFIRLETVWSAAERLQALGKGTSPDDVPPPNTWHLPPVSHPSGTNLARSKGRSWAIAAGVALVLAAASTWYIQTAGPTYRTAVGGIASVPMTDGSKVTLNTDSTIRLAISEKERGIELDRGEAFFEVAPDPTRPFVVSAGSKRIVAVGTQFSVRRTDRDEVQVVVTQGKVRVEDESAPSVPVLLGAGGVIRTGSDGVLIRERAQPKVEEYLSWRTGFLVFREVPLAQAAAEFNRYNGHKLLVRDPAIASIPVSGRFRTTNFEGFVRLIQDGFPVRAHSSSEGIILTQR